MKLRKVQVTEFRSVTDSGEFEIGDITCLVGKNEAGKTAVLKALHRLNPLDETAGSFSVTDDYPRATVTDYESDLKKGKRKPAHAVRAVFELSEAERRLIEEDFGPDFLQQGPTLTLQRGYYETHHVSLSIDEAAACRNLVARAQMPSAEAGLFAKCATLPALIKALEAAEESEHTKRLKASADEIQSVAGFELAAYRRHLKGLIPKFLYFDEYYQMLGHENIEALKERVAKKQFLPSDHPILGLVELAGLTLDDLLNPKRTLELKNRLEGAGNKLSRTILNYWSQNKNIHMRFDVRPGRPEDPEGMRNGTNLWAEVYDSKHLATTLVGERSRGFVWFFSFLAWYAQQQGKSQSLILLLDEPGLTLHGSAQGDLLRYIEKELGSHHQIVYTTHSPFMVDSQHLDRVRIVQDRAMEEDNVPASEEGTKVFTDVLRATPGSLFPLHGALGFEVQQTLFVGPNVLVVEGVSDLLFIQTMTGVLERKGRKGLDSRWVIAPVGGVDKVPAFAALFGAQKTLTVATLLDLQTKDIQTVENLYKQKLLAQKNVHTYAEFCGAKEADAEDMFGDLFYLELVSGEYNRDLPAPLAIKALPQGPPRVLPRLDQYFTGNPLMNGVGFNHYRPARYLSENIGALEARLPAAALDRFEKAFEVLNALLPAEAAAPVRAL